MSPSKAILSVLNEPSHDYVGLPVSEIIYGPVDLWFSAVVLFLGLKSKISQEKKCYLFSILYTPSKFQASRFNNNKNRQVGRSP